MSLILWRLRSEKELELLFSALPVEWACHRSPRGLSLVLLASGGQVESCRLNSLLLIAVAVLLPVGRIPVSATWSFLSRRRSRLIFMSHLNIIKVKLFCQLESTGHYSSVYRCQSRTYNVHRSVQNLRKKSIEWTLTRKIWRTKRWTKFFEGCYI